jgi:hypothetical protein
LTHKISLYCIVKCIYCQHVLERTRWKRKCFVYIRKSASFSVLEDAFQSPKLCSTINVPLSPAYLLIISKQLFTKRYTRSGRLTGNVQVECDGIETANHMHQYMEVIEDKGSETYFLLFPVNSHMNQRNLFVQLIISRWLTSFSVPL